MGWLQMGMSRPWFQVLFLVRYISPLKIFMCDFTDADFTSQLVRSVLGSAFVGCAEGEAGGKERDASLPTA